MNEDVNTNINDMEVPPMEMRRAPRRPRMATAPEVENPMIKAEAEVVDFINNKILPYADRVRRMLGCSIAEFFLMVHNNKVEEVNALCKKYSIEGWKFTESLYGERPQYKGYTFYTEYNVRTCQDGSVSMFTYLLCDEIRNVDGVKPLLIFGSGQRTYSCSRKGADSILTGDMQSVPEIGGSAIVEFSGSTDGKENIFKLLDDIITYCRNRGYDGAYLAGVKDGADTLRGLQIIDLDCVHSSCIKVYIEKFLNRTVDKSIVIQTPLMGYMGSKISDNDKMLSDVLAERRSQGYDMYIIYCNTDTDFNTVDIQFTDEEIYPGIKIAYAE